MSTASSVVMGVRWTLPLRWEILARYPPRTLPLQLLRMKLDTTSCFLWDRLRTVLRMGVLGVP